MKHLLMIVAIVMLAIFKNDLPTNLTACIFGMIIAMAATIQLYARKQTRSRKADGTNASG